MQANAVHMEDCHLLGLDADANLGEVERAWRNLKVLYAEDSLATYGLMEESTREEKLEELEGAYGRIVKNLSGPAAKQPFATTAIREECLEKLSPNEPIGQFLRQVRESSRLTLKDISNRTKVSPRRLEQIEQEMFEHLPVAIYVRGFVLEYAKVLGLPQPQEVAGMYLTRYKERVANL